MGYALMRQILTFGTTFVDNIVQVLEGRMNQKGISLIEVLVSMLLVGVGLLGLAPMLTMTIEANSVSRDALEISSLAKEKLEVYQNADSIPALPFESTESGLLGEYTRHTHLWDNTTDSLVPEGICLAEVTISWTDDLGVDRSAAYSTVCEMD